MIFKPELAALVLAGRKTQTRRPVKDGEERCRYVAGRAYAVQRKRGGREVARIHIDTVRREPLEAITDRDARREGFDSRTDFFSYWLELYDRIDLAAPVWVLSFTLLGDEPRLLAPLGRVPARLGNDDDETTDADVGYTTNPARALRDEPEAVGRGEEDLYAEGSRRVWDVITAEDRLRERAKSLGRRVKEEAWLAGRAGKNVDPELDRIEQALQEIRRKHAA